MRSVRATSQPRSRFLRSLFAGLSTLALLLPLASLWTAPAHGAPLGIGTGQPRSGGSLVIGRRVDALQFDPIIVDDNPSLFLLVNLYDPLLRVAPTGVGVEPAVAASYE